MKQVLGCKWREYRVLVGNVGQVYSGHSKAMADQTYRTYVAISRSGRGRAGNEPVTLIADEEIVSEFTPVPRED